jgi:hypothetical protein
MFYNMTHPGAVLDPHKKATRLSFTAFMIVEGRQQLLKPFIKAGYCIGWPGLHFFQVQ